MWRYASLNLDSQTNTIVYLYLAHWQCYLGHQDSTAPSCHCVHSSFEKESLLGKHFKLIQFVLHLELENIYKRYKWESTIGNQWHTVFHCHWLPLCDAVLSCCVSTLTHIQISVGAQLYNITVVDPPPLAKTTSAHMSSSHVTSVYVLCCIATVFDCYFYSSAQWCLNI